MVSNGLSKARLSRKISSRNDRQLRLRSSTSACHVLVNNPDAYMGRFLLRGCHRACASAGLGLRSRCPPFPRRRQGQRGALASLSCLKAAGRGNMRSLESKKTERWGSCWLLKARTPRATRLKHLSRESTGGESKRWGTWRRWGGITMATAIAGPGRRLSFHRHQSVQSGNSSA